MFTSFCCVALVLTPPPVRVTGGGDEWGIMSVDFETATHFLGEFARTYGDERVDFHRSAVRPGRTLQGVLGLTYQNKVRAILHFDEKSLGVANITSIAAARHDYEAATGLAGMVRESENLALDVETLKDRQPRWYMALVYLDTK